MRRLSSATRTCAAALLAPLLATVTLSGPAAALTMTGAQLAVDGSCGLTTRTVFKTTMLASGAELNDHDYTVIFPGGSTEPRDATVFYVVDSAGIVIGAYPEGFYPGNDYAGEVFFSIDSRPTAAGNVSLYLRDEDDTTADQALGTSFSNSRILGQMTFDAVALDADCVPVADTTAPTVSLSSAAPSVSNLSSFTVTATFSESVTGVALGDFTIGNGTPSGLSGSGTTYSFTVSPVSDGVVTVNLAANTAQDGAGNGNTVATQLSRTIDRNAPTVTLSTTAPDPTGQSSIPVTATFSESVTGVALGDFTIGNGTPSGFSGAGTTYTFNVAPVADGAVTVNLAANMAVDAAGNGNTVAVQLSRTSDRTQPVATISTTAPAATNLSPIPFTVTFTEAVTGLSAASFTATNGAVTNLTGSGASYSFDFTPAADGAVGVMLPNGAVTDAGGNTNPDAFGPSLSYDGTGPTATLAAYVADPTNSSAIQVDVIFDENVAGLTDGDFTITNGVLQTLTIGNGLYAYFTLVPSADGPVTVTLPAGTVLDETGNPNAAPAMLSVNSDRTGPVITLPSTVPQVSTATLEITPLSVSEALVPYNTAAYSCTNADLVSYDMATGTAAITALAEGLASCTLGTDFLRDGAGNLLSAPVTYAFSYDASSPGVTLSSTAPNPTFLNPIPMTATFTEPVTGFTLTDILVGNGTPSNLSTSDGLVYSFDVAPAGQGPVTVGVAADAAQDPSGNGNTAATQISRSFDGIVPSATMTSSVPSLTFVSPIPVTVTFSEDVTDFTLSDLVVSNATATNLAGSGAVYSFDLVPAGDGEVAVDIFAEAAWDLAGNGSAAVPRFSRNFDGSRPGVAMTSPSPLLTSDNPIAVTVTFTEPVFGFDPSDLVFGNATAANFTGTATTYHFDLIPLSDGPVTVDIAAPAAEDLAGNVNTAAPQFLRTFDGTLPGVILASTATDPTAESPILVTVTFSEAVTGFDAGDLVIVNGSASGFVGSGAEYSFQLTPSADGPVTVDIAANVASDGTGHGNTAAPQFQRVFDSTRPGVTLATTATSPTSLPTFAVTVTFTEDVTGFDEADLVVTNAAISAFGGAHSGYSFVLTPTAEGPITVDVAADVAVDDTGLGNTMAEQLALVYDPSRPTVVLSGTPALPGTGYTLTVTFSEPVTGLGLDDFLVGNATLSNLTGSGSVYTLTVTALDAAHSVQLGAAGVVDAAGNPNEDSNLFENVPAEEGPTLTITGLPESFAPGDRFTITFTFSAPVDGFDLDDIVVTNGSMSGLNGGPSVYTATLVPDGLGSLSVSVPSAAAEDATGAPSQAASASAVLIVATEAGKAINDFLQFRARALIQNQAQLTPFVNGRGEGQFTVSTSGTGLSFDIHSGMKKDLWFALSGSTTEDDDGGKMDYALATIGLHREIGRNAVVGVMLQYDMADMTTESGIDVQGEGWLVGPYIAGQIQDQPLWFEGRLLYGHTDNSISPLGRSVDDFSGERWLAQFAVEGQFQMDRGVILYPSFTLSHVSETQFGYTDGMAVAVPGQSVALTEAAFGLDLEMPVKVARGELILLAGISGILSSLSGDDVASAYIDEKSDSRGRVDLGLRYSNGAGLTASIAGFLDGIGSDFDSTGIDAEVALEF